MAYSIVLAAIEMGPIHVMWLWSIQDYQGNQLAVQPPGVGYATPELCLAAAKEAVARLN